MATSFGLLNNDEDLGQTLGYWGYENSTYLMLPFIGPSTIRDISGRAVDMGLNPLLYVDDISVETRYMAEGLRLLDKRADLLAAENLLFGNDRYSFIRSASYQIKRF